MDILKAPMLYSILPGEKYVRKDGFKMENQELLTALSAMLDEKFQKELTPVKKELSELKKEFTELKADVSVLKEDVSGLKKDMTDVKQKVTTIEITLENETNRNIEIIAEGHHILDRKLDEALKSFSENELYKLRINRLDAEVKIIAQKNKSAIL